MRINSYYLNYSTKNNVSFGNVFVTVRTKSAAKSISEKIKPYEVLNYKDTGDIIHIELNGSKEESYSIAEKIRDKGIKALVRVTSKGINNTRKIIFKN
jgi:hypothetical protein